MAEGKNYVWKHFISTTILSNTGHGHFNSDFDQSAKFLFEEQMQIIWTFHKKLAWNLLNIQNIDRSSVNFNQYVYIPC